MLLASNEVCSGFAECMHDAADELAAMREAEKAAGRKPDPAMDAFLKAQTLEGADESIVTEYMLKTLGLDVSFRLAALPSLLKS